LPEKYVLAKGLKWKLFFEIFLMRSVCSGNWASFTITAIVALGLGIGANTAIFSLVNTVLLKEPPFPKADRIVILESKTPRGSFAGASPGEIRSLGAADREARG
jgi:hypothetical protein